MKAQPTGVTEENSMSMYATNRSKSPKGLEDYQFERTRFATFDGLQTRWSWQNRVTGDYETKFGTKAQAVSSARRFKKGLAKEKADLHEAHLMGRHASTHPEDKAHWVRVGCEGCSETHDVNGLLKSVTA